MIKLLLLKLIKAISFSLIYPIVRITKKNDPPTLNTILNLMHKLSFLFPKYYVYKNPYFSVKLYFENFIDKYYYLFWKICEQGMIESVKNNLSKDDVFIDIGANIGIYSLLAAKIIGKSGKIYAFEGSEKEVGKIYENIHLNNLDNIIVINSVVGEKNGLINFKIDSNISSSNYVSVNDANDGILSTSMISVDSYLMDEHIDKISLIKIDVEGYELYVLKGMEKTINKFRPKLIVEIAPYYLKRYGTSSYEIYEFFKKIDYSQFQIINYSYNKDLEPLKNIKKKDNYHNILFIPN